MSWVVVVGSETSRASRVVCVGPFAKMDRAERAAETIKKVAESGGVYVSATVKPLDSPGESASSVIARALRA